MLLIFSDPDLADHYNLIPLPYIIPTVPFTQGHCGEAVCRTVGLEGAWRSRRSCDPDDDSGTKVIR